MVVNRSRARVCRAQSNVVNYAATACAGAAMGCLGLACLGGPLMMTMVAGLGCLVVLAGAYELGRAGGSLEPSKAK